MHLIAPEILAEARSLSVGLLIGGEVVGLLLWLFGWWGHRFWIVLVATVAAGILGLLAGPNYGLQPFVAGILLAVSAGVLALTLIRLVAYAAGGLAAWLLIRTLAPLWEQPVLCFLIGGLIGLVLFRFWTMTLTSFAGTLLMLYGGLCLADTLGGFDSVTWADEHGLLLNWALGGMTFVGLALQFFLERRRLRKRSEREDEADDFEDHDKHAYPRRRAG